jgi:hypothetical protein
VELEIKACKYNCDTDSITFAKPGGSTMTILCSAVEETLHTTVITRSKLVWLKENEPSTYAELIVTDRMQDFLSQYGENYRQQEEGIEKQLTEHFNGDKAYAAAIAREIMMYDG